MKNTNIIKEPDVIDIIIVPQIKVDKEADKLVHLFIKKKKLQKQKV